MVQRQILNKLSVLLTIGEPEEMGDGVFKTALTHPLLKGELSFVHSELVGRDEVLKKLDENIIGQLLDVVTVVGDLINDRPEKTASRSSGGRSQG